MSGAALPLLRRRHGECRGHGQAARPDLLRGPAQRKQELLAGFRLVEGTGDGVHADGRHHASAGVSHGDRQPANGRIELAVDPGVAPLGDGLQFPLEGLGIGDRAVGEAAPLDPPQHRLARLRRQRREEDAAQRDHVRGQPAADAQVGRQDAAGRLAQDVDDLAAVEYGERAGFLHLRAQVFEHALRLAPVGQRAEIGHAERQCARLELEVAPVRLAVIEFRQRRQEAAGGRPVQPRREGDLGQRVPTRRAAQRLDHLEPARQRPDVTVAVLSHLCPTCNAIVPCHGRPDLPPSRK